MSKIKYKHVAVTDGWSSQGIPWVELTALLNEGWDVYWSDQVDGLFHFILAKDE